MNRYHPKRFLFALLSLFLFSACRQNPEPTPTIVVQDTDSPTTSIPPTETKPTETDEVLESIWIQIELVTTSDWADLYTLEQEKVLSFEVDSLIGEPTYHYGGADKLTLEQPISEAETGASVGITVNYELAAGVSSLDFLSQRGGLNENYIRILNLTGDEPTLLLEVDHDQVHDEEGQWNFSLVLREPEPGPVVDPSQADIIFYNGVILVMENGEISSGLAVKDEFIMTVGDDEDLLTQAGPGTTLIDLEGRTLMPGFIDAHSHILNNPWRDDLEGGQALLLSNGITTSAEMFVEEALIQDLQALDQLGKLRVRISLYPVHADNCGDIRGDWYSANYPVSREPGAMLQIPGIKMFNDGGSCNAPAVSYEYTSGYGNGDLYFQADQLSAMIITAQELGYQVAIHALGDRAIDVNLNAIEIALGGSPNSYHHRIEHNTVLRDDMLPRYSEVDPVAVIFGNFPTCAFIGDTSQFKYFPPDEYLYLEWRWRDLMDANPDVHFAWHSDTPYSVGPYPLVHLYSFVTRLETRDDGSICEPPDWAADDLLTVEEALQLMTIEGAYALLREQEIGSLTAGKLADLIVLSANPLEVDPEAIRDIEVLMTMVGGNVEYCLPGQGSLCP